MQGRRYRLPHVHVARHHRSVNRRANHRVVQIGLGHCHSSLFLADLRLCLCDIRGRRGHRCIRRIIIGLCHVHLLLAVNAAFGETHGAVVVGFGLHQRRLGLFQVRPCSSKIGLGVFQVRSGLQQRSLEQGRIDQRDDVALMHARVEIHIKL